MGKSLSGEQTGCKIIGQQPLAGNVKSEIDSVMNPVTYWFAKRMANWESGYKQFDSQGMPFPNASHDGGYGIFQLTPPFHDYHYWSWKANITGGKITLDTKNTDATNFWNNQVQQFNTYNQEHPNSQVAPPVNTLEGPIEFSFSPQGAQKSYRDAIWIKQNNGATANYISWKNTGDDANNPYWKFNRLNEDGVNYVNKVCTTSE
jgi:hypothetical protein